MSIKYVLLYMVYEYIVCVTVHGLLLLRMYFMITE